MVHAPVPAAGPRDPLLVSAQEHRPTFALEELANGLLRANMSYSLGLARQEVSFLIRELPREGAGVEDTLQCVFTKYVSAFA